MMGVMKRRVPRVVRRVLRRVLRRGPSTTAPATPGSPAAETPSSTTSRWPDPAVIAQPSFVARVHETRRRYVAIKGYPELSQHPMRLLPDKLRTYDVARAVGVAVPTILGRWDTAEEIDLSGLPEVFVLKANGGAASRAVLPLERVGEDAYRVVSGTQVLDADAVRARMSSLQEARRARPPWFAEAFLGDPAQGLPHDVKIYTFYGVVGHVLVRSVGQHGRSTSTRFSFYDEHGTLLPGLSPLAAEEPVPPPPDLEALCEIARTMSLAVSLPFVRVDLYSTPTGPVLGELTLAPGGKQLYRKDHDRRLGKLWESAATRLEVDLLRDRSAELIEAAGDRHHGSA